MSSLLKNKRTITNVTATANRMVKCRWMSFNNKIESTIKKPVLPKVKTRVMRLIVMNDQFARMVNPNKMLMATNILQKDGSGENPVILALGHCVVMAPTSKFPELLTRFIISSLTVG